MGGVDAGVNDEGAGAITSRVIVGVGGGTSVGVGETGNTPWSSGLSGGDGDDGILLDVLDLGALTEGLDLSLSQGTSLCDELSVICMLLVWLTKEVYILTKPWKPPSYSKSGLASMDEMVEEMETTPSLSLTMYFPGMTSTSRGTWRGATSSRLAGAAATRGRMERRAETRMLTVCCLVKYAKDD